ncbi:DUF6207 family protein [Streptomyces sp. NPDC052095]|uniref:DUF6207 family protein n=1 Tax=unclassified Streptomyces TaxID=2593676 RepID=UPI00344C6A33
MPGCGHRRSGLPAPAELPFPLEERWAAWGISPVRREPGVPGVRARVHADVLRPGP